MEDLIEILADYLSQFETDSLDALVSPISEHFDLFSTDWLDNLDTGLDANLNLVDDLDLENLDIAADLAPGGVEDISTVDPYGPDDLLDLDEEVIARDDPEQLAPVSETVDGLGYSSEKATAGSGLLGFLDFGTVHGDPEDALDSYHYQEYTDTCAIACQIDIIEDLTGKSYDESMLRSLAMELGYYTPGEGTPPDYVGALIEMAGIDTENHYDATLDDLRAWLDQDGSIIVGVDAVEIWEPAFLQDLRLADLWDIPEAGHAVRVTGIEDNPITGEATVILNDPGVPDGAGVRIPADDFLDAWEDTGRFACITT
jgi:hypothetical protein